MGMYDSFSAEVICKNCEHVFFDDGGIQSKDFECMMDHLIQGERTDKLVERSWLHDSHMSHGSDKWDNIQKRIAESDSKHLKEILGKTTKAECAPMTIEDVKEKYKDDAKWSISIDDKNWYVYKKLGKSKTVFDGIHGMDFYCYTSCPKCKASLELTGYIVDDVFTHVVCDSAEPREN